MGLKGALWRPGSGPAVAAPHNWRRPDLSGFRRLRRSPPWRWGPGSP